jgi:hypothetical protein
LHGRRKTENIPAVTLDDAWRELGLEPGADAETVRRAYLRLIKTRKPEQDPVGFQRAREAYEIARAGGEFEALAAASARRHAAPHRPAPDDGAPADEPDEDESEATAQADVVFDGFSSAWHSVPPSADQRARLEIAREAVAVLPDDPRAYWLLATTLSRLGPEIALVEALRAGWRKGWPEFLEALLVRVPEQVTREEIDAAFASDQVALRLAGAAVVARWDGPRAAKLVVELCREAVEGTPDAKGDRVRDLPIERMLDVVLALHASGALEAAEEAQSAVRDCLHDTGLELALVQGPLGGVWTLAEEIGGLPHNFPQPLRAAFARATRAGDLNSAFGDTCAIIERDRGLVSRWADHLGPSSQNVRHILQAAVAHQAAVARNRAGFQFSKLSWVAIPVMLGLIRFCSSQQEREQLRAYPIEVSNPRPDPSPLLFGRLQQPVKPGSSEAVALDMAGRAAADICGSEGPRHGQLVCADVERVLDTLRTRSCDDVPDGIGQVKAKLGASAKNELEARFFNRLTMARFQICGNQKQPEEAAKREVDEER